MTEHHPNPTARLPSKRFVALLYLPLMLPALLPIYLTRGESDPTLLMVMYGTAFAILMGNVLMLVVLYRWFASAAEND